MKLARVGAAGSEKPAILDDSGELRDLSSVVADIDHEFLCGGGLERLRSLDTSTLPSVDDALRFGAPVAGARKIVCTGPNYKRMSDESGAALPSEPRLYMKADTSLAGPNDDVVLPRWATTAHWEVELAVIVGREVRSVSEEGALDCVAGFAVVNDICDHNAETAGFGESMKGRSADGFGPLGPWLVTKDEVRDLDDLRLWLRLNGELVQDGSTADMWFKVPFLVSYISRFLTLRPGDVICTGTPGGVGLGAGEHVYLKPGDTMQAGIDGMGEQRTRVLADEF